MRLSSVVKSTNVCPPSYDVPDCNDHIWQEDIFCEPPVMVVAGADDYGSCAACRVCLVHCAVYILLQQAGIARALYNLGNVYHAHGKQLSRVSANHEPGKFSTEVVDLLQKAVNFYKLVTVSYFF